MQTGEWISISRVMMMMMMMGREKGGNDRLKLRKEGDRATHPQRYHLGVTLFISDKETKQLGFSTVWKLHNFA